MTSKKYLLGPESYQEFQEMGPRSGYDPSKKAV